MNQQKETAIFLKKENNPDNIWKSQNSTKMLLEAIQKSLSFHIYKSEHFPSKTGRSPESLQICCMFTSRQHFCFPPTSY